MLSFKTFDYFSIAEIFSQNTKNEILDIMANERIYNNMIRLLWLLNDIREFFFDKPIYITSFYRCKQHNIDVGGVSNSYHLLGAAVDVTCSDMPVLLTLLNEYRCFIKYIHYPDKNFVHIQLKDPKK